MTTAKSRTILQRQIDAREKLWPELDNRHLWYRKEREGFVTLPRVLPLIMHIMDHLSGKGFPVGQVYMELWCRTFDEGFLALNRPGEMAFHSGFTGQRAVRTWKDRIKRLEELGFIGLKAGPLGDMSYAVVLNPFHVIKRAYIAGSVPETHWQALVIRANEVGAIDFDDLDDAGNLIAPVPVAAAPMPTPPVSPNPLSGLSAPFPPIAQTASPASAVPPNPLVPPKP